MTDQQFRSVSEAAARPLAAPAVQPPSTAVRRAWFIPGAVLALAALAWGTFNVLDLLAHGEYTTTTFFSGQQVERIDIVVDDGSVTVNTSELAEIVVTAEVDDGWRRTGVSQRIVDGVLELRGECPTLGTAWCNVDFTVTMPADIPLTVDGASGSVNVRGTNANVDVETDNGSVVLDDLAGDVRASTDNGRIVGRRLAGAVVTASTDNGRIELSFVDPPDSVDTRTGNGSIDIVVPDDDVAYRLDVNAGNGSTDSAVRSDPASDHLIVARTGNGSITVRPPG